MTWGTPAAILGDERDAWELWICLLLSLFLQIFLIVFGTFRRLAFHKWIVSLLWIAYLLAEIVAVFALGLIVSRQRLLAYYCIHDDRTGDLYSKSPCYQNQLHLLWAPFLLLHLGGPDTITAFAPEDNELWLRHVIYLASQCIAVAYCFYQSLQFENQVMIPTLLVLLCGIIKCAERTAALYYGSASSFRNSMLSKSDLDANAGKKESKLLIKMNGDALSHLQVLQNAFVYFTAFKGLVVDLILSIHERNQSREFFLSTSCQDAYRLVEVELHYLYDVLFTKIPVLHHKLGYCCRALSFSALVASLLIYISDYSKLHVEGDHRITDKCITFILLIGAIVLEVIAFYMLLFCDWTVVKLRPLSVANANGKPWKDKFLNFILFVNITRSRFLHWFLLFVGLKDLRHGSKFTDSRWANSLSTFNLIYYCLHRRSEGSENFYSYLGLISFLNGIWYVKPQSLTHYITGFIFEELKMKSEMAGSLAIAREICFSKGEWVLHEMDEGHGTFLPFVSNYNYDDILLLWHIATELCYNDIQDQVIGMEQRETAKKLSDYMLYLMVMKPDMMSGVSAIGEIKFRDTCTEVRKFLDAKLPELQKKKNSNFRETKEKTEALQRKACEMILSINRDVEPVALPSDRNIFITALVLAKELKALPSEKRWLIVSKLWVELLSYAASHIRSSAHAVQLSRGGELITVVWFLMAHFGLGDQYEINPGTQA